MWKIGVVQKSEKLIVSSSGGKLCGEGIGVFEINSLNQWPVNLLYTIEYRFFLSPKLSEIETAKTFQQHKKDVRGDLNWIYNQWVETNHLAGVAPWKPLFVKP